MLIKNANNNVSNRRMFRDNFNGVFHYNPYDTCEGYCK